jgi:hypothetical protein
METRKENTSRKKIISTTYKRANKNFPKYTHLMYTGVYQPHDQLPNVRSNRNKRFVCTYQFPRRSADEKSLTSPTHPPNSSCHKKNTTKKYHNQRKTSWPIRQLLITETTPYNWSRSPSPRLTGDRPDNDQHRDFRRHLALNLTPYRTATLPGLHRSAAKTSTPARSSSAQPLITISIVFADSTRRDHGLRQNLALQLTTSHPTLWRLGQPGSRQPRRDSNLASSPPWPAAAQTTTSTPTTAGAYTSPVHEI